MSQTQLDYNDLMFGANGEPFRYKTRTVTGAVDLLAGTVLVPDGTGKYRSATDADKVGAAEQVPGWEVLLEDAAVTGGDTSSKSGTSGGVFEDKLIAGTGLTAIDNAVINKLSVNNIYVQGGTDTMAVAGEGA